MIIKSHVRGGYRAAADYLKQTGGNEHVRLVEISDPFTKDLDEAFANMWAIGKTTRAKKPLHHVSINPYKDERLTDEQVLRICKRLEEKYGYVHGEHQRVIVEHIKDGRQHFHVMWNRVNLRTGRPVWPGHHWNKSKQAAREMEVELALKRPSPRRTRSRGSKAPRRARSFGGVGRRPGLKRMFKVAQRTMLMPPRPGRSWLVQSAYARLPFAPMRKRRRHDADRDVRNSEVPVVVNSQMSREELIAWAWENQRSDILAQFGIYVSFDL